MPAPAMHLAELDALRRKHQRQIPPLRSGRPPPRPPWPPRPPPPPPPRPPPPPPPKPPPPPRPPPPPPRPPPPPPPPKPPPPPPAARAAATATAAAAAATAGHRAHAAAAAAPVAAPAAVTATAATAVVVALLRAAGRLVERGEVLAGVAGGHDLALVDPALDADAAERRAGLVEAVVDVGAQRVQRHAAVGVGLRAGHLGAAQAAADLDLAALGARAHGARERALHRAPEGDAVLQLLGDRLRDELGVELGALDLQDVDLDGLAGDPVQVAPQRVHLGARLADHDARAGRVDVDLHLGRVLADRDVGEAGVRELVRDVIANPDVLDQEVAELASQRTSSTSSRGCSPRAWPRDEPSDPWWARTPSG